MRDYAKKESELQKEAVYWKEEGISDMREQIWTSIEDLKKAHQKR